MSDVAITMLILAIVVLAFMTNRLPVGLIALGAAVALYFTGILDLGQALAGFGDPAVILIASLFVVAEGLDSSGLTAWAGQQLVDKGGRSQKRLTVLIMIVVGVLAALISVNGAVAALLPVVVVIAMKVRLASAKLLLPLAFGAHAGSLLTLTGSPVNVVLSDLAEAETGRGFGFFEFTLVGLPLVIGTVLITLFVGNRLIPARIPAALPTDLSNHARTLADQFGAARLHHSVRVGADSPLIGEPSRARSLEVGDAGVVEVISIRPEVAAAGESATIRQADVLLIRGEQAAVLEAVTRYRLTRLDGSDGTGEDWSLLDSEYGVAEIIIPPRSAVIGDRVFAGMVTESGDLVVLAVRRAGEVITDRPDVRIEAGDVLLVQGRWDALDRVGDEPALIVVDSPDQIRRQAAPLGGRAKSALVILVVMVALLATGVIPAAVTGVLAAAAMILTGVLRTERAHRSISWPTVLLVGGMIPMSTAITQTGAADLLGEGIVDIVGAAGPLAVLASLCALALILGQLISNTATALIIAPIAISVAAELSISPLPFLMAVAVVCAASFLTPVATPANLMVMGPSGLKFADYWKLGLPLALLFFAVAVLLVPVIWPF